VSESSYWQQKHRAQQAQARIDALEGECDLLAARAARAEAALQAVQGATTLEAAQEVARVALGFAEMLDEASAGGDA
jgi:hypothetical protein